MTAAEDFADVIRAHVGAMHHTPGDPWPSEMTTGTLSAEVRPVTGVTGHTTASQEPDPAGDFAAFLGERIGTRAEVEPEPDPGPRVPAPNPAQGSSGATPPRPPNPVDAFADFLLGVVSSTRGDGGWYGPDGRV